MNESLFKKIENKTGVSMDELFALANAIQHANFQDERQVRKIIRKVGKLAKKDVSKQLEDQIAESILKNGNSLNVGDIQRMIDKNG
ncbi:MULTISPECIES: stage VI sporulation protein F [Bhargavaea]|uniref:Sporulation protein n=2 Tax=Bhargavaea TaxID=941338 RepID=A0A1G7BP27_9BACL|nr:MULTISPECIES: stage VI sporulation protein F [Bhargavaea]MCW1926746.1 stage VI sporulation protein F [Bhargavaea beijingensis]RSK37001.1 sporulation protein [Bhargavaea beijingensis]SDE28844.1 Stage VI sporulation protein F [Bhargavaea beijingensis]